jgi:hypothetical protein
MPKKDVNDSILGMLSTAGSNTRPVRNMSQLSTAAGATPNSETPVEPLPTQRDGLSPGPDPDPRLNAGVVVAEPAVTAEAQPEVHAQQSQRQIGSARKLSDQASVPRTLRLRPATANELRDAWLEAKRDDVLLTAQDFASDLLEEMLKLRRRRTRAAS